MIDFTTGNDSNSDDRPIQRRTLRPQLRRIGDRTQRVWSTWPNREDQSRADASGRPKRFATLRHCKSNVGAF